MLNNPQKEKTPIAVFTYNRPFHAQRVLQSLSECRGLERCSVHIFCDGPKDPEQYESVKEVRTIVKKWESKLQAHITIREKNLGLAHSIVHGVSELCHQYGRVIVLEDDLVPSVDFLDYMTQALDIYQDVPKVCQISGYMFPIDIPQKPDTLFLPLITTWGWATWDRAWQKFDWNAPGHEELFKSSIAKKQFDLDNSYPYCQMLKHKIEGKNDSWGILWWYAIFRANGLVLYPSRSLIWMGGFDGTGIHCRKQNLDQEPLEKFSQQRLSEQIDFPYKIVVDEITFKKTKIYLRKQYKDFGTKIYSALRQILWKTIHQKENT